MITANNNILLLDLNNFLENICPLFADKEYKVREATMQLFKTFILLPDILKKRSTLDPFYGLLNVYLSCTMTHIDEMVQHSSLKLLDIFIEHMPDLVRIHAYTIFENFVDQISKVSLRDDKRVLKNDPYKMTSTQAWRHNVLGRLYKMLLIVSAASETAKHKASFEAIELYSDSDASSTWKTFAKSRAILLNFDEYTKCSIVSYLNEADKSSLKIW